MKVEWRFTWPGQIAFVAALSLVLPPTGAVGSQAGSATGEVETRTAALDKESTKGTGASVRSTVDRVSVSRVGQQTEVRIEGRGRLSCAPFRVNSPERLVLDFSGALVRLRQRSISSDLQPVRGVRVGQFNQGVARVVIDLAGDVTYTVRADNNVVIVLLGSAVSETPSATDKQRNDRFNIADADRGEVGPQALPNLSGTPIRGMPLAESLAQRTAVQASARVQVGSPVSAGVETSPARDQTTDRAVSAPVQEPPGKRPAELTWIPPDADYVIGPQDVIAVNVWREPELSRTIPVRPDGKISLPLVGDLMASGLTPRILQTRIAKELEVYLHKPQVTVIIQEANSHRFYIIGEVERPGSYGLATRMTVLDALAAAGGFRDFAKVSQIYLLRRVPDGSRKRIAFNFKAAVNGVNPYPDLELLPGDTIVVP